MNICFRILSANGNKEFITGATALNLLGLKGHRSVGGMRASNYNSVSLEGAGKLAKYLKDFAKTA
jgi:phosphoserine aminotransferase